MLNPRERNGKVFAEIVANIKAIGLKKPVVVTPRPDGDGGIRYLLVCGEGRLKAFKALGETAIPALVIEVSEEDAFIMSLAENIARRQSRPLELLVGIEHLRDQGYNSKQIASKTGLTHQYVHGILTLLKNGEQRLLVAVEKGKIPLNAALAIVGAGDDDKAVQAALQEAYEAGTLRGRRLIDARKVLERRATSRSLHGSRHASKASRREHIKSRAHLPKGGRQAKGHGAQGVRHTATPAFRRERAPADLRRREFHDLAARGRAGYAAEVSRRTRVARRAAAMSGVTIGFQSEPLTVPIARILPCHKVPAGLLSSRKYAQIRSSIAEIGLIEPLSIAKLDPASEQHLLLDGHIRLVALQDLGWEAVPCLVATDDEGYTYNSRINRLSTIQEHLMIRRAIDWGVSPERLANALTVDVSQIIKKSNLLDGICPEATELLKDRHFSAEISRVLRKMKPMRQVECAELMCSANNLTVSYAEALLVATPIGMLVDGKKPSRLHGVGPEQMARMEREMTNLQAQYRLVEQSYGQDVLNLVLAKGYLTKLLENQRVVRFVKQRHPEVLEQLTAMVEAVSLEQ